VGGDEFVVVLPETDGSAVGPLLGRCLTAAPRFSFGVATAPDDAMTAGQLLDIADGRLLAGRRAGRAPQDARPATAADHLVIELGAQHSTPRAGVLEEIVVVSRERTVDVEVALRVEGRAVRGRASGSNVGAAAPQVAARAVIDALVSVDPNLADAHIDGAEIVRIGTSPVAVVTVVLPSGEGEDRFTGAAVVRDRGPLEAAARAMLGGLARHLSRIAGVNA
jgi:hypothetical protein